MNNGIFITGTDTGVGKTVATLVLAVLLRDKGMNIGVMKPVQCAGDDAKFLKKSLNLRDSVAAINPYFAPEPFSPHLAFSRRRKSINISNIKKLYEQSALRHDVMFVEGAGGLMVPLKNNYFVADLIRDLGLDLVIVARLGLGTINHTLLTISQARAQGLHVRGVIFSKTAKGRKGIPETTNPDAIKKYGKAPILGVIPYLEKFDERHILRTCRSKVNIKNLTAKKYSVPEKRGTEDLSRWDQQYLWHPFTQMQDWLEEEPVVIERADGCYLTDTDGRRYLDGISSLWVNVHGHKHKRIDEAVKQQIDRVSHSTLLGLSNVPAVELAKKLVEISPAGLEKVFYSDNGSTAVEVGLKMTYQYWQNIGREEKKNVVHLANAYHGDTLGSVSVGGIGLFHRVYRDLVFKSIQVDFPDCYRAPAGKQYPGYAFECLEKFENYIKSHHQRTAAFVVEPLVQGAAGMIVWPEGILKRMVEVCQRHEVIFIADEVATGFGRTGKMFACEHEGVSPDILCLAKGITGGYLPLAATLTTKKIFDGFCFDYKEQKTFFHGHTYTGNPLACAAALANLEVFAKDRTLEKLAPKIKYLSGKLELFYNLPHVGDVRQHGFMVGIELVHDRATKGPYPWEEKMGVRVCREARRHGVMLRPLGNVIVLMPPLAISMKELGKLLDVTYGAIEKVTQHKITS